MWIQTAWVDGPDGPYLVAAYDEGTFEAWGREPDFYRTDIERAEAPVIRELRLMVSDVVVNGLFALPTYTVTETSS